MSWPDVSDVVAETMAHLEVSELDRWVRQVSSHDRFQASVGINEAAEELAGNARSLGLSDVRIDRFPADGKPRWWSFEAPASWTPTAASLEIRSDDRIVLDRDQTRDPFLIATNSAPTPAGGLTAPVIALGEVSASVDSAGSVILVDAEQMADAKILERIEGEGARGLIGSTGSPHGSRGRIELTADSPLFGFSVTADEIAEIKAHGPGGSEAHCSITVERGAELPVVSASIPGEETGEIWLLAHLCHPRPSANDNASGVAAVLGAATALRRAALARPGSPARTIRCVWGPEFTGTAAFLHSYLTHHPPPLAVINLDMVGNDPEDGEPLLVERTPEAQPSVLNRVAEAALAEAMRATPNHPGRWGSRWFRGMSDHALFADPRLATRAIALCHAHDPANHTSDDCADRVSGVQLMRSAAVAAATASIAARVPTVEHPPRSEAFGGPIASWNGPPNLRAMVEAMPGAAGTAVRDLLAADKSLHSILINLMLFMDGAASDEEACRRVELATDGSLPAITAARLVAGIRSIDPDARR